MVRSRLSLHKHIHRLQDPRLNRRKRHLLGDGTRRPSSGRCGPMG
jgi:hypothetical protein